MDWDENFVSTTRRTSTALWPSGSDYLRNPTAVDQDALDVHEILKGNTSHWTNFDVSTAARLWHSNASSNFGVIMWAHNEEVDGYGLRFASRQYGDTSLVRI